MKRFLLLASLVYANDYFLISKNAQNLEKEKIVFEYQKLNDTVDVFNIKDDELKNSSFGSIGDLDGFKIYYQKPLGGYNLYFNVERKYIDYTSNRKLINNLFEIKAKRCFNNKAIDLGLKVNFANDLSITNTSYLETLAKRFFDIDNIAIGNNQIAINNGETTFITLQSNPSIDITNLNDKTIFTTFIIGKKINNINLAGFLRVNYTLINTTIKANILPLDDEAKEKLNNYDLSKELNRDEVAVNIGFNFSFKKYITVEGEYYYTKIFRDNELDYIDYNHVFKLNLIKDISKNSFVYIGGVLLYRQFNGEIPYLYNEYTQTTFDHKYGWANIGIGYNY